MVTVFSGLVLPIIPVPKFILTTERLLLLHPKIYTSCIRNGNIGVKKLGYLDCLGRPSCRVHPSVPSSSRVCSSVDSPAWYLLRLWVHDFAGVTVHLACRVIEMSIKAHIGLCQHNVRQGWGAVLAVSALPVITSQFFWSLQFDDVRAWALSAAPAATVALSSSRGQPMTPPEAFEVFQAEKRKKEAKTCEDPKDETPLEETEEIGALCKLPPKERARSHCELYLTL